MNNALRVLSLISLQMCAAYAAETACITSGDCEDEDTFSALQHLQRLAVGDKAADTIPKIVHHIYKYDISAPFSKWPNAIWEQSYNAWKTLFPEPEYTHMFWSDKHVLSFIQESCPKYHKAFINEHRDIVRADFARYCILWQLGGIYADLDYEPLQNFYGDLEPGKVNLIQSPYRSETYQNSLMASPAHHPYWQKLMDLGQFTMHSKNILLAAGPQLLETIPLTHNSSVVHGLSCNSFQRATHTDDVEREASLKKGCKLLEPSDFSDLELKGIHWGTVSYFRELNVKGIPELPTGLAALFTAYRQRTQEAYEQMHNGDLHASRSAILGPSTK